jgi:hypothetical protein
MKIQIDSIKLRTLIFILSSKLGLSHLYIIYKDNMILPYVRMPSI